MPGSDNPQEKRICRDCKAEKVVTPESWPYRKGREGRYQANGLRCLACEKVRKAKYEEIRNDLVRRIAPPAPSKSDKAEDKRKPKLDVDGALKAGAIALNQVAPSVLARIMMYLEDEEHPQHQWALELLAQRILPRKLYEELGGQAAGVGTLHDKRPTFVLNITPAVLPPQHGATYDMEVPALPAPEEANQ